MSEITASIHIIRVIWFRLSMMFFNKQSAETYCWSPFYIYLTSKKARTTIVSEFWQNIPARSISLIKPVLFDKENCRNKYIMKYEFYQHDQMLSKNHILTGPHSLGLSLHRKSDWVRLRDKHISCNCRTQMWKFFELNPVFQDDLFLRNIHIFYHMDLCHL